MPYIEIKRRAEINDFVDGGAEDLFDVGYFELKTPGELNYAITMLIKGYHERMGGRYQHVNDILGALEGAKLEFYRRVAAPYEDKKIAENEDVY